MEGAFRLLLVAGLLAALLPAAAATFGPQPGTPCEPTLLATQVSLFCAPHMPTAQCCQPVVAAVDLGGGVPCLCLVAAEPQLVMAGLNATHLLTLYTFCGGLRPGGAHLAAACEGPAPPAAVVSAPPPSPGPRRKQPAHEAAPPPSTTEKPSPPPQQHDGAAHSKEILAYAATSPLAPAAAISPAAPQPPHSGWSSSKYETGCFGLADLSTAVAVRCGLSSSHANCCETLFRVINPNAVPLCICELEEQPAIKEAGFSARNIIGWYASCVHIRPGDIHFPSTGCIEDMEPVTPPSPMRSAELSPSSAPLPAAGLTPPAAGLTPPAVGTQLAPPAVGTQLAPPAPGSPSSASSTSNTGLLVAILIALVLLIIIVGIAALLFWRKGLHGWMQMVTTHPDEHDHMQPPPNLFFLQIAEGSTSSVSHATGIELSEGANNGLSQMLAEVRRASPRLHGIPPGPSLPTTGRSI